MLPFLARRVGQILHRRGEGSHLRLIARSRVDRLPVDHDLRPSLRIGVQLRRQLRQRIPALLPCKAFRSGERGPGGRERSEEHTSELQSHHDLVCRLLLEKKKRTNVSIKNICTAMATS